MRTQPPRNIDSVVVCDCKDRVRALLRRNPPSAILLALLLLLALATFLPSQSPGLFSDGARYQAFLAEGVLTNPHFAYLPAASAWMHLPSFDAHAAGTSASAHAAAFGAVLVGFLLIRIHGPLAGIGSFFLALLLSPALRFHASQVEVHATAFFCAAVAWALIWSARTHRRGAYFVAMAGFVIVLGHLSSCLWLPALAIAAGSKRLHGIRQAQIRRAFLVFAGGAAGFGLILLAGWNAAPLTGESLSPLRTYLEHWTSGTAMPAPTPWLDRWMSEVSGPFGLLLPLALIGAMIGLLRGELQALGIALAFLPGIAIALVIGAFENGAYLLPALPPLAYATARTMRALLRAPLSAIVLAFCALVCEGAARAAWAIEMELPRAAYVAADVGFTAPMLEFVRPLAQFSTPILWMASSGICSIAAAFLYVRLRAHRMHVSRPFVACFCLALFVTQLGTQNISTSRRPSRDQRELVELARATRTTYGAGSGLLLSIDPSDNARAILERELQRVAYFLPAHADADAETSGTAREALRFELSHASHPTFFPADLYAPLVAREDFEAIDCVRAWEAEGLLHRLPHANHFRSLGFEPRWDPRVTDYAARADRELPAEAHLVTCIGDGGLRGALAAQLARPFIDLAADAVPPPSAQRTWYLCDQGLCLWLDRLAVDPLASALLPTIQSRVANQEWKRWVSDQENIRARAEAFWESARKQR